MDLSLKENQVKIVELFKNSGLSQAQFCKSHNVSKWTLYRLLKMDRESTQAVKRTDKSLFIPVHAKKDFKIKINDSTSVSFETTPDAKWLASFVKYLGEHNASI